MDIQFGHIGIIGGGVLGRAIGQRFTEVRLQVLYYDTDPSRTTTGSIEDLVRSCPLLLLCIPSWEVHNTLRQIAKHSHPHEKRTVLCFSKGVEKKFTTMDELLVGVLPKHYTYGLMYGPMIAEEIAHGRPAHPVLAVSDHGVYQPLRQIFTAARIYPELSTDMHGVALCAVLKNVYAIAFGVSDGLHLGLNAKGRLAVMVLSEMKKTLASLGADPYTADTTAGLGDLLSTGYNTDSFNYSIGKTLAEGIANERIKSEGLVTLHELERKIKMGNYPVANAVSQIAFHFGQPQKLADLLQ